MSPQLPTHLLVVAKSPVPGRVKTRLCPPFTPRQCAEIAAAALADTLDAVARCGADRLLLALDGDPGPWLPPGFEVVPQGTGPLGRRLAAAWAHVTGPGVQIGMDTPQVGPAQLDRALAAVLEPGVDAVLGPAEDGGWWAIGQRRAHPGAFTGVPMSTPVTGLRQEERLRSLGMRVARLETVRDLDTAEDAAAISALAPDSRTAAAVRTMAGVRC